MLLKFNKIIQFLMAVSIAVMAVMIFTNVVMRYAFNSGILVSEELSRYFFVWLTFLGAISAYIKNTHIKVETFFDKMPPRMKFFVYIFNNLVVLACCVMLTIGCWRLAMLEMINRLPISDIPVGVLFFAGVPAGVCISIIIIIRIFQSFAKQEIVR